MHNYNTVICSVLEHQICEIDCRRVEIIVFIDIYVQAFVNFQRRLIFQSSGKDRMNFKYFRIIDISQR